MRWNPTMPTTHKIKLTDIIDAGLTQDIKTLRGKQKHDRFAEQARLIGWTFDGIKFTCRKCRKDRQC